jgi:hypothetical protein
MKKQYFWILLICLNSITIVSIGQIKSIPVEVTETFRKMFPEAGNADWKEKIDNFSVFFHIKDMKCEAKFTKKGDWISTEESIIWDSLPATVRDGLKLSKYADWKEKSSYILISSEGITQYHIVVTKEDMGRKILFFNQNGQLVMDHESL